MKFLDKCLEDKGESCPYCGNKVIDYDNKLECLDWGSYFRSNWCSKCRKDWHTIYSFSRIDET